MSGLAPVRIATRASKLAMWQANHTAALLKAKHPGLEVEIIDVTTLGDRDQTSELTTFGGIGVFTREVQKVVLDGQADIAVHSLKDLPTETAAGLTLAGVPARAPVADVLICGPQIESAVSLDDIPPGARIGTGSVRRRAQLLYHRQDLKLLEIRGNVDTRLAKLAAGDYDAIVLAQAGIDRLELEIDEELIPLIPPLMYPAVGQGALGLECRADDETTKALLQSLTDQPTWAAVIAERSLLARLRAGCHAPVGALSSWKQDRLTLEAVVLSADGTDLFAATHSAAPHEAEMLGQQLADELIRQGADSVLGDS